MTIQDPAAAIPTPWFHSINVTPASNPRPGGPDDFGGRLLPPMTIGRTAMRVFDEQIARATAHVPPPKIRR